DQILGERPYERVDEGLTALVLAVELGPDAQAEWRGCCDGIKRGELKRVERCRCPGAESRRQLLEDLARDDMQRAAEIRECGMAPDLGLQIDREGFRKEAIAVGQQDVDQLVQDRGFAADRAPSRNLHATGVPVPCRDQRLRYAEAVGNDDIQMRQGMVRRGLAPAMLDAPSLESRDLADDMVSQTTALGC